MEPNDFNAQDNDGFTALMWAADIGNLEIVDLLIASLPEGSEELLKMINLQDGNGCNALTWAIGKRRNKTDDQRLAILTRLLEAGGDPNSLFNARDKSRLLHYAAQKGNTDLLKLLIEKGFSHRTGLPFLRANIEYLA